MFARKAEPTERASLNYDQRHDVLYISLGQPVPSFTDEEGTPGVFVRRDMETGEVTGATILDYSKRNKSLLERALPFRVNLA